MLHFRGTLLVFIFAGGIASAQQPVRETYPSRAVTVVVPFAPGGTADAVPRIVADRLRERWRQTVIIENRPGNAGNVGAALSISGFPPATVVNGSTILGGAIVNQALIDFGAARLALSAMPTPPANNLTGVNGGNLATQILAPGTQ